MLTARSTLLVVLGARAVAGEEAFRTDMLPASQSAFTSDTIFGISDIATAVLTKDVGIVCYSDWENGGDGEDGKCKVVDMAQDPPTYGDATVLTMAEDLEGGKSGKAQRFTMSRFSDTLAVVCYTPFGDQIGVPVCRTLTVAGDNTLSAGSEFEFVPNSTTDVYTMGVASLTPDRGVLCFQDTSLVTNYNQRHVVCTILQVSGESLSVPERIFNGSEFEEGSGWTFVNDYRLDNVQAISLTAMSDTAAVVCYNDGTGLPPAKLPTTFCNKLIINGDSLGFGDPYELGAGSNWAANSGSKAVSVAAFSDTDGVACMCSGDEGPVCTPLNLIHDAISEAGTALQIGDSGGRCREVTVVAMSETAAVACWLTNDQEAKNRRGMCKGLSYLSNQLNIGDAEGFPQADDVANDDFTPPKGSNTNMELWQDNDCESWFSVSKRDESNAMACYSAVGGSMVGRCVELTIPDPTTTVTTATTTETSTTSEHTTTESSTTTATETSTTITTTTVTTTTQTSSTTPHTTTATETSTTTATTAMELSSGRSAFLALPALLLAAAAAAW